MKVENVHRIGVLRPSPLGDFVFALPALAALRAAYPQAHIALLGLPWQREFLAGRPGPVDEVIELPPMRGLGAGLGARQDDKQIDAFVHAMRARRFDIAMQLYGGGRHSNPFLSRLGARVTIGMRAVDAPALDRWIEYMPWRNERLRLLEVVALAGASAADLAPPLAAAERDEDELQRGLRLPPGPLAVLQPGARDPRRRWSADRFAAVGDALAAAGARIVVHGSEGERELVGQVADAMHEPALDASGALSLSGLAALLRRARLLVSNDTGPLHLAQAVGTSTVGIYWFMNLIGSAPLMASRHRHAFSTRTRCPVCDEENVRDRCEHDVSFVDDVGVEEVKALALRAFSSQAADRPEALAPA
jgi:ADP-heptose:LPS heptosyltransferase